MLTKKAPKKITHRFLRVFSRHNTIEPLKGSVLIKGERVVYRHGSTTQGEIQREINSVEAVKTSADKLLMKRAFDKAGVFHAPWKPLDEAVKNKETFNKWLKEVNFPEKHLIAKHRQGSRGSGNYLIRTQAELDVFIKNKANGLHHYIIELYMPYTREYRLHVTERGCFYTCRKVIKNDTPKDKRFQRHDDNCNWLIEENPKFDKPSFWDKIVQECVNALKEMKADVLAFDVKCTSPNKTKKDGWIIIESCSAPAFGKKTLEKYKVELPLIVAHKYNV